MPKLDSNGSTLERAKFPALAAMANIFHPSMNSTSCGSEQDFWALSPTWNNLLRCAVDREKMEKICLPG